MWLTFRKSYSTLPLYVSKSLEVPDQLATAFPAEGIDLLLGWDLFKELNETFHTTCDKKSSPECQQQLSSLLEKGDGVSLQARAIEPLSLIGTVLALYFSAVWMMWTREQEKIVSISIDPLIGIHMPQSDHAQIASWASPSTIVFATASGDSEAVSITPAPMPTPALSL
jgi:hypothetical protein